MFEKKSCSRETVLNYLMDRYKTTYSDIAIREVNPEPLKTLNLISESMAHFAERDTTFQERVEWTLDRICTYFDAAASYFVLYGRNRSIYLSTVLQTEEEDKRPKPGEFSLLLINRMKSEFKPGRVCYLNDVEKMAGDNREVYNKMSSVGIRNEILMPVFSYGSVTGFLTIYNIKNHIGGLYAIQNMMDVIATTGNELEFTVFKYFERGKREADEDNSSVKEIVRKNNEDVLLANAVSRRLGQNFRNACLIDLEKECYTNHEINKKTPGFCCTSDDVGADFNAFASSLEHKEFREGLRRFLFLEDLGRRLEERDEVTFEYMDNDEHWCRCAFQVVLREETGAVKYVLFTEEVIDREKRQVQENLHFLRTVSDLYLAVYRIDMMNGEMYPIKPFAENRRFESFADGVQEKMDIWTAEHLYPEASKEEREFFNLSTLPYRLRMQNKVTLDIVTTKLGWVRIEFLVYSRGMNGEAKSILWMVRSIIEEKKAEALNNAISETYTVLVYASLAHNRYKTLIHSNRTAKYLPEESSIETALGILRMNVDEEYRDRVMEFVDPLTIDERMTEEKSVSMDYVNAEGDWARITITQVKKDLRGRINTVVFSIQHIDDIKRKELEKEAAIEWAYEEAKQANATKSGFFSNLSHDIRTPMNAIVGMTRIALENLDNIARVEDCLEKIKSSSDHLLALINDSLDLSRIESGKIVIAHDPVNLREMENNFMSIMQGYMVDRKLEIITDCQAPAIENVLTDGLRLRQVVLNILSNAVKYTPDGKNIIYRTENKLSPDGKKLHMKFTIADSGIGMTQDFLKRIYEPFSQVERDGMYSRYKGTGLGMVIVKNFVDMLGGTIDIQSEVNVGTIVTLNFDFDVDMNAPAHRTETEAVTHKQLDLRNVKILLVEDNDINREIAVDMLKGMHMDIVEAVDGEDAVYKFRASAIGEYKCIFMDIMMPLMNGYEATRAIRSMDRDDAKKVPIIAMTANAFMEDVKTAKDCGMNEHISKPIDPANVKEIVEKFLAK